ncbi:hypothetical protein ILUMI_06782 [Ignelater luminosus]|uniref:Craniofacial development protein 2-like n=1 Tax=Ignelater luminosus TaxID=2038154 RepID=A0A8K0D4R5_IGNLU|nr:hypothetical protein ILUMI_06782 [Ignelater luminosus]
MSLKENQSGGKKVPQSDLRAGTTRKDKNKTRNTKLNTIGTWNVRTLWKRGKLENVKREMQTYEIDLMELSEIRWSKEGDMWSGEFRIINTAGNNGNINEERLWAESKRLCTIRRENNYVQKLQPFLKTLL